MDIEPKKPYIYQPYGMQHPANWHSGRIYAIGGLSPTVTIKGLTKREAERILEIMTEEVQDETRAV